MEMTSLPQKQPRNQRTEASEPRVPLQKPNRRERRESQEKMASPAFTSASYLLLLSVVGTEEFGIGLGPFDPM